MKRYLKKLVAGPIKHYNIIKIKSFYNSADICAVQITDIGKTLVIIPHVDDEVIGLGGLMCGMSNESVVHLLYGTDSGGSSSYKSRSEISSERFTEAELVAMDLNVEIVGKVLDNLNGSDEWSYEVFKQYLIKLIDSNNYDSIFTVSHVDAHPDHVKLTYYLSRVLKECNYKGNVYLYEVSNLLPNDWINVYYPMSESVFNKKMSLYNYYKSQAVMDFDIFNQLNIHKGLAIGESRPVEYFAKLSKSEFINLVDKVRQADLSDIVPYRIGGNSSFYKVINREKMVQRLYKKKGW